MTPEILQLAQILRDYLRIDDELMPSDLIIVLWSYDTRVADRGIELFHQWYGKYLLFSWWWWRADKIDSTFSWSTESEVFAKIAIEKGVPNDKIIIENKSRNTWENIRYSYELIKEMNIHNIILVQKSYMWRRTLATFKKQWPWEDVSIFITSNGWSFENEPNDTLSWEFIINVMVWDLQRIIEYPVLWFQIYQEVPENVMNSYDKLIELGFTDRMIK